MIYIVFFLFVLSVILIGLLILCKRRNTIYVNGILEENSRLIANVSHELRTPMTSIMGLTNIVLDAHLDNYQRENLTKVKLSSEYLLAIINNILDVSKMKSGKVKLEEIEFNINDTLDYVFSVVYLKAKEKSLDFNVDIDNDVPAYIIGDSLRLGQILINLFQYKKPRPKGGVRVQRFHRLNSG